jgi:hypothetical protein
MGQKSSPIGLRLQINRTWDSRWYAEGRDYQKLLKEDIELRKYIDPAGRPVRERVDGMPARTAQASQRASPRVRWRSHP